jgi:hypothetical protein
MPRNIETVFFAFAMDRGEVDVELLVAPGAGRYSPAEVN